jgi:hypothetical protein
VLARLHVGCAATSSVSDRAGTRLIHRPIWHDPGNVVARALCLWPDERVVPKRYCAGPYQTAAAAVMIKSITWVGRVANEA